MDHIEQVHLKAVQRAVNHRNSKGMLIDVLIEAEKVGVPGRKECRSLFAYCKRFLFLGEDEACTLIAIARKSLEVPEIKTLVQEGKMTMTNARRIVKEITPENKTVWLEKGQNLSQADLLKEIVKVKPEAASPERMRPVAENKSVLTVHICDRTGGLWKEASDVMARKGKTPPSKDALLAMSLEALLDREDPLRKAQRVAARKAAREAAAKLLAVKVEIKENAGKVEPLKESSPIKKVEPEKKHVVSRRPLPASTKHAVMLRDGRQCRFRDKSGVRCDSRRYLDVHHVVKRALGGSDDFKNLITLCSAHHRHIHDSQPGLTWSGPDRRPGGLQPRSPG